MMPYLILLRPLLCYDSPMWYATFGGEIPFLNLLLFLSIYPAPLYPHPGLSFVGRYRGPRCQRHCPGWVVCGPERSCRGY